MPFKPLTINTAENVPAHILAQDDAALYSALWGNQSGIAPIWDNLKCDKINDNLVRLGAGVVYIQGHAGLIRRGDTHDVPVVSGSAGQNRIDLIVAEFKRTGATDDILIKVVQGASTSGTPVQPAVTQQDISGAGTIFQLALYSVKLTGTSLGVPVRVAPVLLSAHDLFTRLKSTGATNGASQIAIHDASDKFVASDVEMALSELASADSAIQANVSLFGDVHYATEMKNGNGSNSYVQFQLYAPAGFTARGAVWQFQCNGIVVPYSIVFNGDNFIANFSTPTGIAMPTNYAITLHIWFKKKAY